MNFFQAFVTSLNAEDFLALHKEVSQRMAKETTLLAGALYGSLPASDFAVMREFDSKYKRVEYLRDKYGYQLIVAYKIVTMWEEEHDRNNP